MRLASYLHSGVQHFGAIKDGKIVNLDGKLPIPVSDLKAFIEQECLSAANSIFQDASVDCAVEDVTMLPPIAAPEKIWCIGVNYANRNEEYKDGKDKARYPSLFCRSPTSIVGHGQPLERPYVSEQLDYEGEIVLIIGKEGRHIRPDQALDHVFGVTLCNEGTVRDWLHHSKFNVTQGKNFDKSGSIGPWIVTTDEIDLKNPLELTTKVNGEIRQHDDTSRMILSFEALISYLSTFATLRPGDHIVTGTPTGAGARFTPPRWLVPGDVVEVAVPEIGVLRNYVRDEPR